MNSQKQISEVGKAISDMAKLQAGPATDPYAYMLMLGGILNTLYSNAYKIGYSTACADSVIKNANDGEEKEQ